MVFEVRPDIVLFQGVAVPSDVQGVVGLEDVE
jgi:hypothetical protein